MQINIKREINFTRATLAVTFIALAGVLHFAGTEIYGAYLAGSIRAMIETAMCCTGIVFLTYSNILYQVCLIGYYMRMKDFRPTDRVELDALYDGNAPSLSIIIPSYKEERLVNWQTMMSAALSEYPTKNVVLLIDDPYQPKVLEDILKIEDTRKLPGEMQRQFDVQAERFRAEQRAFQARQAEGDLNTEFERSHLASQYEAVAAWLDQLVIDSTGNRPMDELTHGERFFTKEILQNPAAAHRALAATLREENQPLAETYLSRQYARLVGFFTVYFSSFERKKYANLSHEANKAMNINSYVDLVGKSWREVQAQDGLHLVECSPEHATFTVPAADYIDTIDSDTLMLGEYVLRLVHLMEQPENHRIAVCQSPCSTIPGAPGALERLGGAMIDVQFRTHQGYTHWGASFWVGANAMLRHKAMLDIKEVHQENGYPVPIYIQDRTVIEDTESTIDLVDKGWKLHNYPERMTFSAMPPDFGSLLIQRRRWSNGGLIILPKLLRYAFRAKKDKALAKEMFMRYHYLASTTTNGIISCLFFFYPFSKSIGTPLLCLVSLPIIVIFARDLKNSGYRYMDSLRCMAFNLMLLPVVAGGVLKQFQQMITGKKIPFGRTPKVTGRTAAPALYCALELGLMVLFTYSAARHAYLGEWSKSVLALLNVALFVYCLVVFMGVRDTFQDLIAPVRARLRSRTHQAEIIQLPTAAPIAPLPVALAARRA